VYKNNSLLIHEGSDITIKLGRPVWISTLVVKGRILEGSRPVVTVGDLVYNLCNGDNVFTVNQECNQIHISGTDKLTKISVLGGQSGLNVLDFFDCLLNSTEEMSVVKCPSDHDLVLYKYSLH